MTLFLDSNVLLDVFTDDEHWGDWSRAQISRYAGEPGRLLIDGVVYAEISIRYPDQVRLDEDLDGLGIRMVEPARTALFAAGKAFAAYRRRGGARTTILPDFIIGAHASDLKLPLATRDTGRYRAYFPDLVLVTP